MRLKELEIDNFKSFANKADVPFLEGFTTISGPNGSGKSNIIDSILFALGLSSSRALRSERGVSDLITTHNSRNEASVKVVFELDENTKEELSILRKVKKSSQGFISSYYMNNRPSSLSQIHLELEKYNVTPNGYNVIMQGDVANIINCSPVERRKIVDEIAGVADFDRKIDLAHNELETVEKRVADANIILDEVDKRMEALTADREVALKYKRYKDEKTDLESKINVVRYFDTKRSLSMVHENILNAQKDKKLKEIEQEKFEKEIVLKKAEFQKLNDEIREKGEDKQLEVMKQAEGKRGEIERKNMAIDHNKSVVLNNKKTIENAKNGIENCAGTIEKTKLSIAEKEKMLSSLEDTLLSQKDALKQALFEISGLDKTANEHIEHRRELKVKFDALSMDENKIIKEKIPLEGQLTNFRNELDECNKFLSENEDENKVYDDKKDRLGLQIEELNKELEDCKALQQGTFNELDKTKNKLQDVDYNIRLAHTKIAEIEAKKQAYKEYGLGGGVDLVLRSNLKGVHQPLSQLIDVENEYADAIMVALGARSRFVVVDDEHVAVRAIDLLKSQGKYSATFLPLNKMRPAPSKLPLPKEKGIIDYAINLIDFDDKYKNAMFFALGETLIVEDSQSAKKLIGKYRVITLDGSIFEKSGAITGGARRKDNVSFGKSEDRQLQSYKERLEAYQNEGKELQEKQKSLEEKLSEIRNTFSNASNEYNSAKFELQNLIKNHSTQETQLEKKMARIAELTPQIADFEQKLDNLERKHVLLGDDILKVQEEIKQVESLIDEGELSKLKEKTQKFEDDIRQSQNEITNLQNEISKENNSINFQNTTIEQRQIDIERLEKDNELLASDNEKFKLEIDEVDKALKELELEIEELGKNLKTLQAMRDNKQNALIELENQNNILKNDVERIQEQLESYKARRNELEPLLEIAIEDLKAANVDIEKLEVIEISIDEITARINRLQKKMDDLGDVNMKALNDYDEVYERQNELKEKIKTLIDEKAEISKRMVGYEALKKETFLKTYNGIRENFKVVFQELSDGEGDLVLENEKNPFEGGLTFIATIADKKKQRLAGLSGGEKSLTALAFVFAIQHFTPAPFYAFDEVDMHLDAANVVRLANMINKSAKNTQFVVISLRKPMIESADRMIGVTQKKGGITKISGVKLKDND